MFKLIGGKRVRMSAEEEQAFLAEQEKIRAEQEDAPESEPIYRDLSDFEFMGLVRKAGPLTAAQFVEIMQASTVDEIVMLRIMISMSKAAIGRGSELVTEGLQTLAAAGYLDEDGIARIMGLWPTE